MSFRGIPYHDLEIQVDPIALTFAVICDGCGKDNFTSYNIGDPRGFQLMWREYCDHVQNRHSLIYPEPPKKAPRAVYMCVVCDSEPVDVEAGQDTCEDCVIQQRGL